MKAVGKSSPVPLALPYFPRAGAYFGLHFNIHWREKIRSDLVSRGPVSTFHWNFYFFLDLTFQSYFKCCNQRLVLVFRLSRQTETVILRLLTSYLIYDNLTFPTIIPLSGVCTTCFHHVVIKIRHLFLRPAACLKSILLETGVDANDCKYSRGQ
jgi:hypothetical protein